MQIHIPDLDEKNAQKRRGDRSIESQDTNQREGRVVLWDLLQSSSDPYRI